MTASVDPKRLSPASGSAAPTGSMSSAITVAGRTIVIPEEIARGLEARVRTTSFPSVDAFVSFVLARLLEEHGAGGFSEEEERRLRERLRSIGYID